MPHHASVRPTSDPRPSAAPSRAPDADAPVYPVSFGQSRFWYLQHLDPASTAYNICTAKTIDFEPIPALLERSLAIVLERHDALRTTFALRDGEPVQRVWPRVTVPLARADLTALDAGARETRARTLADDLARTRFDLSTPPLMRALLVRMEPGRSLFVVCVHHILADGWSLGLFFSELTRVYEAQVRGVPHGLPPLSVQYTDYALAQQALVQSGGIDRQIAYWTRQLAGPLPVVTFPRQTAQPRTPQAIAPRSEGATAAFAFPAALTEGLAAIARPRRATIFMCLIAALQAVLHRYAGSDDVIVGTSMASRSSRAFEPLIGLFVNTIALRTTVTPTLALGDLIDRVRDTALEAYANQDVPFDRVVREVSPAREAGVPPIVQVMLMLEHASVAARDGRPPVSNHFEITHADAQFDLSIVVDHGPDGIHGRFVYRAGRFERPTIDRLIGHWGRMLDAMVRTPDRPLGDVDLLTDAERAELLDAWQQTARAVPARHILDLFDATVARQPHAPALVGDEGCWNYAELDTRANKLAHHLARHLDQRAVGAREASASAAVEEARVAVLLPRGFDGIAALLAIWKAGAAFVPLDPDYPIERLRFLLEDAAPAVVITDTQHVSRLPTDATVIDIDDAAAAIAAEPDTPLASARHADALAYVIYTSGSTGQPKGVLVPHTGLANLAAAQTRTFGVSAETCFAQFSSPGFDGAIAEIVVALAAGARLCLPAPSQLPPGPGAVALMRRQGVTMVAMPPSVLAALPADALPDVRTIVVMGEAHAGHDIASWQHGRAFFNAYGPTEATVCATIDRHDPARVLTLGPPMANMRGYVLDRRGQPVPVGIGGELHLGGIGITRGYLNRPDVTAERFVPDPFGDIPGARLYRTGDRVCWLPDGRLDFLGRDDDQVKLRGFRIELGEIAAVLQQAPGVRQAVSLVRDRQDDRTLVCYVVPHADTRVTVDELQAFARARLPRHMVPAAYVVLDALPVTASGKIDRAALCALPLSPPPREDREPAADARERQLVPIWQSVLGVAEIGRHDNFFDVGGHSLLAVRLLHEINLATGSTLDLPDLLEHPDIASLARLLGQSAARPERPIIVSLRPAGTLAPLFAVHPGSGEVVAYQALISEIEPERPLYALQDPSPAAYDSIEARARAYVDAVRVVAPDGPYLLLGWSFGGLVAFEMARLLRDANADVAFTGVIDSMPPGTRLSEASGSPLARLRMLALELGVPVRRVVDEAEAVALAAQAVANRLGIPEADAARRIAEWDETFAARRQHSSAYRPAPLRASVHLFVAQEMTADDGDGVGELVAGWLPYIAGEVTVEPLPATHYTVLSGPGLRRLGARLRAAFRPFRQC